MPKVYFLTGLPSAGKTTLAKALAKAIDGPVKHLDGDETRKGLCSDLGFSAEDRDENIRRVAWAAKLLYDSGVSVVCSYVSPYAEARQFVRSLFAEGDFELIYLSTPAAVCAKRDPKHLWAKARAGELAGFTGYDDPYEAPEQPEWCFDTSDPGAGQVLLQQQLHPELFQALCVENMVNFILHHFDVAPTGTKTSFFIGRWQPPHSSHLKLIRTALALGNRVVIGMRDIPADESNPYTVPERVAKFNDLFTEAELQRVRYTVIPEADGGLEIVYGRRVGWGIREVHLDEQTEAISATAIRNQTDAAQPEVH